MSDSGTVAVIGLGLIGGSVARALANKGMRVIAHDRNTAAVEAGMSEGVIAAAVDESLHGCSRAGTIVVALPGDAARKVMPRIASVAELAGLIIDVGSAKRLVINAAEDAGLGQRFVGCHPLAGDHRSGWEASRAGMFEGQRVFVCRTATTSDATLAAAREFWISLGGIPVTADASAHDSRMAWVSHLPHLLSSTLALTLRDAGIARVELGPGGRDMTRLAGSSPEMWSAIAQENAGAIDAAISAFEKRLSELRVAVNTGDVESFKTKFTRGSEWSLES